MKTPAERGRDGLWLMEARKARGYSNAEKGRQAFEKLTGVHIGQSVYAQYESGSRPISPKHLPMLVEFWGEPPEGQPVPVPDAVAAAIDRQTAVLTRLATAVEALGQAPFAVTEQTIQAVARTVVAVLEQRAERPIDPAGSSPVAGRAGR